MREFWGYAKGFLAPLLRPLPSPRPVVGLFGYFLFVLAPLAGLLTILGHVDVVTEHIDWIKYVLDQWWGYAALWLIGLLLLLYAGYKQQFQPEADGRLEQVKSGVEDRSTQTEAQLREEIRKQERERQQHLSRIEQLETENNRYRKRLAPWEQRILLWQALVYLHVEGINMSRGNYDSQVVEEWAKRTSELIEAAFGSRMAQEFLAEDPNYARKSPKVGENAPKEEIRLVYLIERLQELIEEVDSLTNKSPYRAIRADFSGSKWWPPKQQDA